ncbi:MAG: hypothetical protein PHH68_07370 [Candidatus Omnitrophica bacterium]|nr:hypothetical protein [Candidatus Omnitrophota bacterium]
MKELAVLYSGGTDSTCAVALMTPDFDRVHLLTYSRFGVFFADHAGVNVQKLKDKFGEGKFIHRVMNIDKLFRAVSYSRYIPALAAHGLFLLTTCGLCKLAMHIRTLVYCLDNNIGYVCDGANNNMDYASDQIREFIGELKALYRRFGVEYNSPVYEFAHPDDSGWFDKMGMGSLTGAGEEKKDSVVTTGEELFRMGIFPKKNMKGTAQDRRMQARCFQLVLANIFANWVYIPRYGLEKYKKGCVDLYKEKIGYFSGLIEEYSRKNKKSMLYKLI